MKNFLLLSIALALAGAATPGAQLDAAPARPATPAARDWSRTVVMTPEGGYRMGNPAAPVKLVEYGSLTCGHCAAFSEAGTAPLIRYVRTGKVSYEYRNYILNGVDVMASLLARCAPPSNFFRFVDHLYATQRSWMDKVGHLTDAQKTRLRALPERERLAELARISGLTATAASYGVPADKARACLTDQGGIDRLEGILQAASSQGVTGTPTFFLNDSNIGAHSWGTLEPILRESAG